jgi:uncharacterized protein (DUF427 family)
MAEAMKIFPAAGVWVVRASGAIIAESAAALQLDEPGYLPVVYFPRADVAMAFLEPSDTVTTCPHKGTTQYFHIAGSDGRIDDAAWSYEHPVPGAEAIAGCLAFDGRKVTVERI